MNDTPLTLPLTLTGYIVQMPPQTLKTVEEVRDYIAQAIASFEGDPADSDFQEGYLACLKELRSLM